MSKFINVSIVIDKEYLENIMKKSEQRVVHIFFIAYFIFFIVSCLLVIFTNYYPFLFLIFLPYFWIFGPRLDYCERKTSILLKNKYVKISFLFSIIFFISMILIVKYLF